MSRKILSWVLVPLTTFALVAGGMAFSAADADGSMPTSPSCTITLVSGDSSLAPPPLCFDPSGADQDEYMTPTYVDANGKNVAYEVNGSLNTPNQNTSTGGAGQVSVVSQVYDPSVGYYVDGSAWSLTYNLTVTAPEAANEFSAVVGACHSTGPASGMTDIELKGFNTPDGSARYWPYATAELKQVVGGDTIGGPNPNLAGTPVSGRVNDGQSASLMPVYGDKSFTLQAKPGTWRVKFFIAGAKPGYEITPIFVPRCGPFDVPAGDPHGKLKPQGRVWKPNCQMPLIKGFASTKKLPKGGKTTFRYTKGKQKLRPFKILNGAKKRKVRVFSHVPPRVVVTLQYKKGGKWVRLSRKGNFGCGS